MIRVTVELLPLGFEGAKRHLGTATIWNDASGSKKIGNYKYRISRRGNPSSTWKEGEISGFPRLKLGVWDLLLRVLIDAIGHRS